MGHRITRPRIADVTTATVGWAAHGNRRNPAQSSIIPAPAHQRLAPLAHHAIACQAGAWRISVSTSAAAKAAHVSLLKDADIGRPQFACDGRCSKRTLLGWRQGRLRIRRERFSRFTPRGERGMVAKIKVRRKARHYVDPAPQIVAQARPDESQRLLAPLQTHASALPPAQSPDPQPSPSAHRPRCRPGAA